MNRSIANRSPGGSNHLSSYAIILIAGVALIFPPLVNRGLWLYLEARRALIGLEMAQTNDWVVPHLVGSAILTKPPLFYWLEGLAFRLTGSTAEWAPRLPSFLFSLIALCAFARLLDLLLGPVEAFWGALVLLVTPAFHWMAQMAEIEMTFVATGLVAIMGFWEVIRGTRFAAFWKLCAWLWLGLSFMTKGPVVPLIAAASIGAWALLIHEPRPIKRLGVLPGVLLFLLPALAWAALLIARGVSLHVFIGEIGGHLGQEAAHHKHVFYYLDELHKFTFPWAFILVIALVRLIVAFGVKGPREALALWRRRLTEDSGARLFIIVWFVISIAVLSAIPSKRYYYALALAPPLSAVCAMILSPWLVSCSQKVEVPGHRRNLLRWVYLVSGCLVLFFAFRMERPDTWRPFYGKHTPDTKIILWALGLGLIGFALASQRLRRVLAQKYQTNLAPWLGLACMMGMVLFYDFSVYPKLNETHSLRKAARTIRALLPNDAPFIGIRSNSFYSICFYWGITDPELFSSAAQLKEFAMANPGAYGIADREHAKIVREAGSYPALYRGRSISDKDMAPILFRLVPSRAKQ